MKYHQDRISQRNNIYPKIFPWLILILFLFFYHDFVGPIIRNIFTKTSIPFLRVSRYLSEGFYNFNINFDSKENLYNENIALKKRLDIFKIFDIENKLLREENNELKNILKRKDLVMGRGLGADVSNGLHSSTTVFASILLRSDDFPYDGYLVDTGLESGINIGNIAFSPRGVLLGDVYECGFGFSKIKNYSSYGRKTNVYLGDGKAMVEIEGIGGGGFFVSLPRSFNVNFGDPAIFPGGHSFVLALVDKIVDEDDLSFKKIYLRIPENMSSLKNIGIIK